MLFNSFEFLFGFLPCMLVVIYGLRSFGSFRLAEFALIAASLFFYAWWDWRFLGLLLASAIFNWLFGSLVAGAENRRRARVALTIGVGVDLLVLAFFKYRLFLGDLFALNVGGRSSIYIWVLPLGISFWTFEQIIYLVDCYRKQQRPLGIKDYLAFVTFFPRLIAGPIIRPRDFFKSYDQWHSPIPTEFIAAGLTLISIGLFKKVCLADQLGQIVNPIFKLADDGYPVVMLDAWAATLGFAFQIYFDFSGYSDIAIGLALMLGIRLPPNFDGPYKSRSIVEFWRRWHMSLSFFLRDYLYIPLGGNRAGRRREAANIMITMGLGGLWHGAGINFLIWGLLHGCYVNIAHFGARFLDRGSLMIRYVAAAATFVAVLVAWTFFRADSFSGALKMISGLFGEPRMWALQLGPPQYWGAHRLFRDPLQAVLLIYCAFHCFCLPSTRVLFWHFILPSSAAAPHPSGMNWRPSFPWAILSAMLFSAAVWLMLEDKREFIYFQF
jgi:alginate O-acetyltransferase complex protein AlgI